MEALLGFSLDSVGRTYVSGSTSSEDFPVTADALQTAFAGGSQDGYFSVLSSNGASLVYSTYLGSDSDNSDVAQSVAVDAGGNVNLDGQTPSGEFPIENPVHPFPMDADGVPHTQVFFMKFGPIDATLPALRILRSGETVVIAWPAIATSHVLETVATLDAAAWTAVLTNPVRIGDEYIVTIDVSSHSSFFRLRQL